MNLKKIASLTIAALATTALVACGGEGTIDPQPAVTAGTATGSTTPATTPSADPTAQEPTPADTGTAEAPPADAGDVAGSAEDAAKARQLAVSHVLSETGDEGIVIAQDLENRRFSWEVDVLAGDRVFEIEVNTRDETTRTDYEERADSDDRAAAAATVTIGDAIIAALEHTPGIIEDASWDDDRDGWEIDVVPNGADDEIELHVHPTSGEVTVIDR